MKAKEYLQQGEKINTMIMNKQEEIRQWKAIARGCTSHLDGERVQSSSDQQKMAAAVTIYSDIENELLEDIKALKETRRQITKTIEQLPSEEYDMLHKMYIGRIIENPEMDAGVEDDASCTIIYMKLEDFAAEKRITYKWAASIHGRALQKVQKIIDERMVAG